MLDAARPGMPVVMLFAAGGWPGHARGVERHGAALSRGLRRQPAGLTSQLSRLSNLLRSKRSVPAAAERPVGSPDASAATPDVRRDQRRRSQDLQQQRADADGMTDQRSQHRPSHAEQHGPQQADGLPPRYGESTEPAHHEPGHRRTDDPPEGNTNQWQDDEQHYEQPKHKQDHKSLR